MNQLIKKEMFKSIEISRESIKNSLEIAIDNYAEVVSKLDLITYLIINDEKNKA